jgi:hypothetical protein
MVVPKIDKLDMAMQRVVRPEATSSPMPTTTPILFTNSAATKATCNWWLHGESAEGWAIVVTIQGDCDQYKSWKILSRIRSNADQATKPN